VAISGMGAVSALGVGARALWEGVRGGRSGIRTLRFAETAGPVTIAAEAIDFDPQRDAPGAPGHLDRFALLAVAAAREAAAQAGLSPAERAEAAVLLGCGTGGIASLEDGYRRLHEGRRVPPLTIPRYMANASVSAVSGDLRCLGPAFAVASACASANHALGLAFRMVRSGEVPRALAGGAEASLTLGALRGWEALRVLAPDACRPFSMGRRGMVLGEGSAVFVLEPLAAARARGAPVLGELLGFGMSSDGGDLVQPSDEGAARAINAALRDASLTAGEVDHVNAHGTGTLANDAAEARALRLALGERAFEVPVSATKAAHGHALGASAALELAVTLGALAEGIVPPTLNGLGVDPECPLSVSGSVRRAKLRVALSSALAFGGLNAVLVVGRADR
jgi:nodulation protein E